MSSLKWDRLLETLGHRRGASDLLLAPGSPPMIRLRESWRALQTAPLDAATIQALAIEGLGATPDGEVDGYAYSDFSYGDVAKFRASAFGYPQTILLLVAKYPVDSDGEEQF